MNAFCGCCEQEPRIEVRNRPGLSMIDYRIGTYVSFRRRLLDAMASVPELARLTTRRDDDYAITVLDLWSAVGDVLTFYQERYANESFLRTAQRPTSVARLASLIGYRLRPGMAAMSELVLTLDAGAQLKIPRGLRVQSVASQGQLPHVFETLESIPADARFNRLKVFPAPQAGSPLAAGTTESALLRGLGAPLRAELKPSDRVLLFKDGQTDAVEEKFVAGLRVDGDRVFVVWRQAVRGSAWDAASTTALRSGRSFRLFGSDAPTVYLQPNNTNPVSWTYRSLTDFTYPKGAVEVSNRLCLDAGYSGVEVGQRLLVANNNAGGRKVLVTVTAVDQVLDSLGPVSSTVTRVTVAPVGSSSISLGDRRNIVVHEVGGTPLRFWPGRYPPTITDAIVYLTGRLDPGGSPGLEVGLSIEAGGFQPGVSIKLDDLDVGRKVILSDASGRVVEASVKSPLKRVPDVADPGFGHVGIALETAGTIALDAATAVMSGNVLQAGHGETVRGEVVGSGDASAKFLRFPLAKKPLTYVPTSSAEGADSSLSVCVDGVPWTEVPSLYGRGPTAQVFTTDLNDEGLTLLRFGDGRTGAPPPTGQGNVTATYRAGGGLAGAVAANSLTMLLDRLPGLDAAVNPSPATGGADPETSTMARQRAPRTVRTFGRAVSLRDFEDLVTVTGEVAKAQATWTWDGLDRAVHLTVAGQQGRLLADSDLRRLASSLNSARDPNHRLRLANYRPVPITAAAMLTVKPGYVQKKVVAAAGTALLAALGFDALRLGQWIDVSYLYEVLQSVPGVLAVDVTGLMFKPPPGGGNFTQYLMDRGVRFQPGGTTPFPVQPHLRVLPARTDPALAGRVLAAELAAVTSPGQDLSLSATGGQ